MKIICTSCKEIIGIQRPIKDNTEISAKCPKCFQKEKEEALKPQLLLAPGERKDVTLGSGVKGYLTVADGSTKLSMSELMISGKIFNCEKTQRDSFLEYLEMTEKDQVDITFLYSMHIKLDPSLSGNKKRKGSNESLENGAESISYNCTVAVPAHYVISMFDDKAERMGGLLDAIAAGIAKEWVAAS